MKIECPFEPNKNWLVCVIPEGEGLPKNVESEEEASDEIKDEAIDKARKDYIMKGGGLICVGAGVNCEGYSEGDTLLFGHSSYPVILEENDKAFIFFREIDVLCKKK